MTGALNICAIPTELKDELKQFRFSRKRSTNALILKIDPTKQLIILDQKLEDCGPDEICDELPTQQPRYIVISYEYLHDDGRLSYPLYLILYSPLGCNPQLQMMYAGSRNNLAKECGLNRNLEIRDPDELTKELLESKL
uniref:ADF-H domain-containing protein n=1 Tax=Setaria digitata TaxID=48799 RepID=A0A915PTR7_9BILA